MLKLKKDTISDKNIYELQIENEKLKVKSETLQFKLDQANDKYLLVENQLREMKNADAEKIKKENISLKEELTDLRFKMANDTKSIELETENNKLKSQVEIQKSENEHLKELLNTYRAMPDIKNMVDSLSSLAVPHLDELKEFSKMISDSKISQLCEALSQTNNEMDRVREQLNYVCRRSYSEFSY